MLEITYGCYECAEKAECEIDDMPIVLRRKLPCQYGDHRSGCEQTQNCGPEHELHEVLVVLLMYASACKQLLSVVQRTVLLTDERTVVIHSRNTYIASGAVMGARRLDHVASPTYTQLSFPVADPNQGVKSVHRWTAILPRTVR